MPKKILLLTAGTFLSVFLLVSLAQAAPTPGLSGAGTNVTTQGEIGIGFREEDPGTWIERIVGRAVNYLFFVGAAVVPLMVIIGAYMYFTSAGDSTKTQNAKKVILWTCVGFAILLLAKAIVSIVRHILEF